MKKTLSLFVMLFLFQQYSLSQDQNRIDSLRNELKIFEATRQKQGKNAPQLMDTAKANILSALSDLYWGIDQDTALEYAKQCLSVFERIGYKKGIAKTYYNMGIMDSDLGKYGEALQFQEKALNINEETGNKSGVADAYNEMGLSYYYMGNNPEALKDYLASVRINEELGNKQALAGTYMNIGNVYMSTQKFDEALKNHLLSLKAFEEKGFKRGIAMAYNNIGAVYTQQGNYDKALNSYHASLKIKEEMGDKRGIANAYNNIATIHTEQGQYKDALKNFNTSVKLQEEIGNKNGLSAVYIGIGSVYEKQGKLKEAADFTRKGLDLALETRNKNTIKDGYLMLAGINAKSGNYKAAFEYERLYKQVYDSVFNEESDRKLTQQQMQFDFDKKESLTKAAQEKKDAILQKELQKQKLVRNGFIGGFGVVLLFAGMFFTQRNKIKKGKRRSDELLLNILPEEVAEELKEKGRADAKQFNDVTVMFTDFKNFTRITENLSPSELVAEIDTCFKAFDNIITRYNVEKIKTIGDAYMCAGGLPVSNTTHAHDVVQAAMEIQQFMQQHLQRREREGKEPFEIRIGVHTGPVVAGIVGVKKFAYDIWGDTVNIASRMESSGEARKVNISGSTHELVKDQFICTYRGKIQAKNKGEIDMYFVEGVAV